MLHTSEPRTLLLTGFGPFPGIPENPSQALVEALGDRLGDIPGLALHRHILSTEWSYVRRQAPMLLDTIEPDLVLHLGLCRGANSFRIERSAYNQTGDLEDAAGRMPPRQPILFGGKPRLDSQLSTMRIAQGLRADGIAALPSLSAGRYLCNFLYYLSLDWAARRHSSPLVLFLHIPPDRTQGGYLDAAEILRGAQWVLRHMLGSAPLAARDRMPAGRQEGRMERCRSIAAT